LDAVDCCRYQDGRDKYHGSDCILVKDVEFPEGDKAYVCQPWRFVKESTHWKGTIVGCSDPPTAAPKPATTPPPGTSLFCFEAFTPAESSLVDWQRGKGTSIFACDDSMVVAVPPISGAGGVKTPSWVNVDNFIAAWRQVEGDGRYAKYDWVVKVDPDTVFMPHKLHQFLAGKTPPNNGVYVETCLSVKYGFYGALELFSRKAFQTLVNGIDGCKQRLDYAGWGEDRFAQRCMDEFGVTIWSEEAMICDGKCNCNPTCTLGRVAYHPYKALEQYEACDKTAAAF
jgi:hypothetical protein